MLLLFLSYYIILFLKLEIHRNQKQILIHQRILPTRIMYQY